MTHDAERALLRATESVEADIAQAAGDLDYAAALDQALTLRQPVADFFDAVLVESPVEDEKRVRKGLLLRVSRSFLTVADFSRISTR